MLKVYINQIKLIISEIKLCLKTQRWWRKMHSKFRLIFTDFTIKNNIYFSLLPSIYLWTTMVNLNFGSTMYNYIINAISMVQKIYFQWWRCASSLNFALIFTFSHHTHHHDKQYVPNIKETMKSPRSISSHNVFCIAIWLYAMLSNMFKLENFVSVSVPTYMYNTIIYNCIIGSNFGE